MSKTKKECFHHDYKYLFGSSGKYKKIFCNDCGADIPKGKRFIGIETSLEDETFGQEFYCYEDGTKREVENV